ncbi:MAG: DUF86 domain-containing protein [Thermodesulfovibrionia bacterium]|nr:DUF86 domain-containing protein [Thermodesulfovibrionia bacterium]
MRRSYKLYLEDILASANKILNYIGNYSFEDLIKDEMKIDAIVRNFEIIGQATGNISQEIRNKYPFVEWRKIADFRNVLSHEYFGINYKIMWDIIKNKLPDLQRNIKTIIDSEP